MGLEKPKQKPKPKLTTKHRKGSWSPEEDEKLRNYILRYGGHGSWSSVPIEIALQRNRLRWINYLRPGLKRGMFSTDEEEMNLALRRDLGNKWSQIGQTLPGRTDNVKKNYWHTHLKKRSAGAFSSTQKTSQELINSWSANVPSSLSSSNYSSKPLTQVPSFQSFHTFQASSACTKHAVRDHDRHATLSSGLNGVSNEGSIWSSLPKLFFEEWLSSDRTNTSNHPLNPFDDQLSSILMGDTFMDNEFLLHERSSALDCEPSHGVRIWTNDIISYDSPVMDILILGFSLIMINSVVSNL